LASVTVLPETRLLLASFKVTVIVEAVAPSAVSDVVVEIERRLACRSLSGPRSM